MTTARRGAVLLLWLAACGSGLPSDPNPYGGAQPVLIQGYGGIAMEPALSPDGQLLLFNDSNAAGADTNLHWAALDASQPGGLRFTYGGPVAAANGNALDAVASLDVHANLYFISTRSYAETNSTVYRSTFSGGTSTAPELVPGLASQPPFVIFDAFISADGTQLWFAEGNYATGLLGAASLGLAVRQPDGSFARAPDGDTLLRAVNQPGAAQYAPAVSADGLELYFTRLTGTGTTTAVYRSRRPNTASPWGAPAPIEALVGGVVEAAAPSADGKALYYHRLVGTTFRIERVTRD
jgi:WD40-like Beta Propeller Repeat